MHGKAPGAAEQTCKTHGDKELRCQMRSPHSHAENLGEVNFPPPPPLNLSVITSKCFTSTPLSLPPSPIIPSFPFPLPSPHPLHSFLSGFSCFAAQRGAEPRILRASCHVKTLIPAKFHTQRPHLWLKEL